MVNQPVKSLNNSPKTPISNSSYQQLPILFIIKKSLLMQIKLPVKKVLEENGQNPVI